MRKYKIIFTGPVGAGKTTAIAAISDKPPISTDEAASDMTTSRKSQTTVAMDYGVKYLDNSDILHLYGTPGQERFNFRSEEHTSELQSRPHLVCRLLLEKKKISN